MTHKNMIEKIIELEIENDPHQAVNPEGMKENNKNNKMKEKANIIVKMKI